MSTTHAHRVSPRLFQTGASLALAIVAVVHAAPAQGDDAELTDQVQRLVAQLDDADAARRNEAEQALIALGLEPAKGEAFLALLPMPDERMSQETATRLVRIRGEVQTRLAELNVQGARVTLDVTDAPLDDVLDELRKQTGNRVIDYRDQFGEDAPAIKVTLKIDDQPFWAALDAILDASNMAPYEFAEDDALAIVARGVNAPDRAGRAEYPGPFRIEPTRVAARRGLRSPDDGELEVDVEIAWEPRLRPVALAQSADDLSVTCDDGSTVDAARDNEIFNVETTAGSNSTEVTLPIKLPKRSAAKLASVRGTFRALIPGRVVEMKFDDLADAKDAAQEVGGVTVTLNRVVRNQALWEIHMRIRVTSLDDGSMQRGWMFQNVTYLADAAGEKLDHAGFETTMQRDNEAGFAYFFELPEGASIGDYAWVYRTPAAMVNLPIEYELRDIPLP